MARPRVVLLHRKPRPDAYSIEHVFDVLEPRLAERFDVSSTTSPYDNHGVVPRLKSVLWARTHQADVNHVAGDTNFFDLALDRHRTVLTVHDCEFLERASRTKAAVYRWMWLRLPVRRARIVTVPTEATKSELMSYIRVDAQKIRVIPNPLDPVFVRTERVLNEKPVLLQVGARSNKNLERVAHAIEGLPCSLVVVGLMSDEQRDLLRSLGIDFTATGPLAPAQVAEQYRQSDVVVFASTKEGFGLPVIEAQATGRAVVTSNIPPMPEVAGAGACFVDPYDVASIRQGIERVTRDAAYRESIILAGLRNVGRFRPETVAAEYAAVYDELLASRS